MKHIIKLEDFDRKDSVTFFQTFNNPNLSITSEVECTGAKERAKERNIPFFLYYLHAMLKAANEIPEFKYRIDNDNQIAYYDTINLLTVISTGENGAYNTLFIPYNPNLLTFSQIASRIINEHNVTNNKFEGEWDETVSSEPNLFLISALPTLSFTSINFTNQGGMKGYPLSLVGKIITREGKEYIPIGINVNHAFIDGYHIDKFYARIKELLFI